MKRRWKIGCAIISAIFIAFVAFTINVISRIDFKAGAYHAEQQRLASVLTNISPEAQFEDDTCGLHTLRTIYKAYGMDPDQENLRTRLGIDVPSNPADKKSTGTVQPDLLRVLVQDKFKYVVPDLDDTYSAQTVMSHLLAGNMAAALIRRRETGHLHWVAVGSESEHTLKIFDSLRDEPYAEQADSFIQECMLSCILVQPITDKTELAKLAHDALRDGVCAMMNTIVRYKELKKIGGEQSD